MLIVSDYVPVAQLDRVLASDAKGHGFESLRARHFIKSSVLMQSFIFHLTKKDI